MAANDDGSFGELNGVSCPTTTTCVAVGNDLNNLGIVTVGTDTAGSWSWTNEVAVNGDGNGGGYLAAVSCPSPTTCVAVGYDHDYDGVTTVGTDSAGTWTWSAEQSVTSDSLGDTGGLLGVSCPTTTTCVAGENGSGDGVTTVGTDNAGTWSWIPEVPVASDVNGGGYLEGVSCPSATTCVGVGFDSNFEGVTTEGTDNAGTWTWSTEQPVMGSVTTTGELTGVSCPSATTCVAVGYGSGDNGQSTTGTDNAGTWTWSQESQVASDANGQGILQGVDCLSSTLCMAVGYDGNNQSVFSLLTGPSVAATSVGAPPPIASVTNLSATLTAGSLRASWTGTTTATSYTCTLYSSTSTSSIVTDIITGTTSCQFTIPSIKSGYGVSVVANDPYANSSAVSVFPQASNSVTTTKPKSVTIKCVKGTSVPVKGPPVRYVRGVNPTCPSGYHQKGTKS